MQHGAQLHLEDFKAIGLAIAIVVLVIYWRDILDLLRVSVNRFVVVRRVDMSSGDGWDDEGNEPEPAPHHSIAIPHMNHVEPDPNRSLNPVELQLNADEVAAVARMIEHKMTAIKPTKSNTIQAGFGVSRGGSQAYLRASAIYDALFGTPAPAVQYRAPDGGIEPPSHPITGHAPLRTRAR